MRKKREGRILDFTSLSDLFMLISVLFLMLYSVNSLMTGIVAIFEKENAKKQVEEIETTANLLKAAPRDRKTQENINKKILKIDELEKKAINIKNEQKKLLEIAIDREINIKNYRELVENTLYGRSVMESEIILEKKANEALKFQASVLQKVINNFSKKIEQQQVIVKRLQDNLVKKDSILQEKINALNTNASKIEEINQKLNGLISSNEQMAKKLEEANEKLKIQKSLVDGGKTEIEKLHSNLSNVNENLSKLKNSNDQLKEKLSKSEKQIVQAGRTIASLQGENANIEVYKTDLERLKKERGELNKKILEMGEGEQIKQKLIGNIGQSLKSEGINVGVNEKTGEVYLDFKNVYFDYGSDKLSPKMKKMLKKFIVAYANGLFADPTLAKNLKEISLVGSASPTFNKKILTEKELKGKWGQIATTYNLDLSYRRARSIFNYLFNNPMVDFPYKREFLPYLKVTGTGFLKSRIPASGKFEDSIEYCKKLNCDKYHVAKIGFSLK